MSTPDQRPLRIVQLSHTDVGGGAQKTAMLLHRTYRELGHESTLVVGRKLGGEEPGVVVLDNSRRKRGLNLLRIAVEQYLGWQYLCFPGSHDLPRQLGRPWDILFAHNLHGHYFDLGALPGLSRLAPTILMLHDSWLYTGHCAHHIDCDRWRGGCGDCPDLGIPPAIRRDGTRRNWRRKQRIYARSRLWLTAHARWVLEEAGRGPLAGKPSRVIRNSTDLEVFRPGDRLRARKRLDLPGEKPLVLFSGQAVLENRFKDGATLLQALHLLLREQPATRLIALGAQQIPAGFEHLADAIICRRFDPDANLVADYCRAADILAHAARYDTAPLTVMEAMACGLPVVASAVGGIPEYIADGERGLLVPARDPGALAAAMLRALRDPVLGRRLADNAVAFMREHCDVRRQARVYLDWFRELGAAGGAGHGDDGTASRSR